MADRRWIYELARDQHGLVTRAQLDEGGMSRSGRRALTSSGQLESVGTRTYRLAGSPETAHQRLSLACLDTGGCASHRSAAWLHGLGGFSLPRRPDVTVGRRSFRYNVATVEVHTSTNVPVDHVVKVDGVACFDVPRTLLSLAALVPRVSFDRLKGAVDEAVNRGWASDPELWARLERFRCRGRNGVTAFEEVLVRRAEGQVTESWLERETLRILDRAGLPLPICQERIRRNGAFVARVDFLYPSARVVIEVSGHTWHRTKEQIASDVARRRELTLAGFVVLEFTYDDVVHRAPQLIAQVRTALATPNPRS